MLPKLASGFCILAFGLCAQTSLADCVPLPADLISWYPGEGNPNDTVGPNSPGTVLGSIQFVTAEVGEGIKFDGTNGLVVADNNTLDFGTTDSFTIEAWVRVDGVFPNDSLLVDKRQPGGGLGYGFGVLGSNFGVDTRRFYIFTQDGTHTVQALTAPVLDGNFHHLAAVLDRANISLAIYLDGVLQQTNSSAPLGSTANSGRFFMGHQSLDVPSTTGVPFNGVIDELSIYHRALAANEIAALFAAGSAGKCVSDCAPIPAGLIHWYRGEADGTDSAGTNNGSLESGVTAGNVGRVGGAFRFNGTNGGVNLGNVPDLDFAPGSSFTIEAWINPFGPTIQQAQYIVALNYDCSPTDQELAMYNTGIDAGKVGFFIRDANFVGVNTLSPAPLTTNTFHHVAGVREVVGSTKTLKLYVDGVLVATNSDTTTGALAGSGADCIGRRFPCPDASNFNGLIDEVSIYNRALTANEVVALFAAGSAGKCGAPSLTIFRSPTNTVIVSWPSPSTGFGLQQNTNSVSSINWSNVTTGILDDGTNKSLLVNPPTGSRFYRLYKP